ncbi:hypothetical protein E4656_04190 [Natronospirillum operosum]|uniref:Phosphate acyltransferase n=1 Tax=Natronospirillum operosum TaxID=2759953 RepID=A0A4Z0WJD7_9GAMM|nr:hypothetical protein [Natronospirillum operosum]TGG95621.1 hypothetical protein E4656_04190 [Natronospirillum operosum]
MIRLAVDIHGGDQGPAVIIPAVLAFLERHSDVQVTLFGDTAENQAWQAIESRADTPRLQWQHGRHYPATALTLRELLQAPAADDALARMLREHQRGDSDAVVTAADTRTLLLRCRQILGLQSEVRRPALGAWIPAQTGQVLLLDAGASVAPRADDLVRLATLGHRFLQARHYNRRPRLGLLNIGTEETKAKQRLGPVAKRLAADEQFDYHGFVEPAQIFSHAVDLVITDGFSGNILLKSMEASVEFARQRMTEVLTEHWHGRLLSLLMVSLYRKRLRALAPETYNGAPLLGVRGWVVKSHGSARMAAFLQALEQARSQVKSGVPQQLL